MISEDATRTSGRALELGDEHPLIWGTSNNHRRHIRLTYHRGTKGDFAWVTRRVRREGSGNYPLRIKCKTTTSLATLMRK